MTDAQRLAIYDLLVSEGVAKRKALYATASATQCDIQTIALALFLRDCE